MEGASAFPDTVVLAASSEAAQIQKIVIDSGECPVAYALTITRNGCSTESTAAVGEK